MKIAHRLALLAWLGMGPIAAHAATDIPPYIASAMSTPDRPPAATARDAQRRPAELIAFAGLKPGDQVIDFIPGGGYFTRIFANIVGPRGRVYAITPSELAAKVPKMAQGIVQLAAQPAFSNVTPLVQPVSVTGDGGNVDIVWTSDNYHDVYGFFGADHAQSADAAIFAALKPGGVFIVIDHAALPGASATAPTTLHRIDPATVKAQVEAAGFKLEAESAILKNPADPHTEKVFAPDIRGRTDQFVFKFRKPK